MRKTNTILAAKRLGLSYSPPLVQHVLANPLGVQYKRHYWATLSVVVLLSLTFLSASAENQVANLLCEYHTNPLGIDVVKPRLSWQMNTTEKNVQQTAYEIRVANTKAHLDKKSKWRWTSGIRVRHLPV